MEGISNLRLLGLEVEILEARLRHVRRRSHTDGMRLKLGQCMKI